MKVLFYLFIFLNIVACGQGFEAKKPAVISEQLAEYVLDFEQTYNAYINFDVELKSIDNSNAVGKCWRSSNGNRRVEIDSIYFQQHKNDYYSIQQLVFHELGHCYFGLDHNSSINNGNPVSIMYPYAFGYTEFYKQNLEYYISSLIDNRAVYLKSTNVLSVIECIGEKNEK